MVTITYYLDIMESTGGSASDVPNASEPTPTPAPGIESVPGDQGCGWVRIERTIGSAHPWHFEVSEGNELSNAMAKRIADFISRGEG